MSYNNPTPVAACLIPVRLAHYRTALVGIVRGIDPGKGGLALPGGYVDALESLEVAAAREMREELAFESAPEDWSVCSSATNSKNRMLGFCQFNRVLSIDESHALARKAKGVSAEVLDVRLLHEDNLTSDTALVFPLHLAAARAFFQRERDAKAAAERKADAILDRLCDRGDIDEATRHEMRTEVAHFIERA